MRQMLNKLVIFLILIMFVWEPVQASGFSIYAQGARAFGLAGAFVARADDLSAIFYNPAGIGNITGTRVQVGSTPLLHNSLFEHYPVIGLSTKTFLDKKLLFLPTIYFTSRITTRITAGFGMYSPFGFRSHWGDKWPGQKILTDANFHTRCFNPVLAYRVTSGLNFAVGYQYVMGNFNIERFPYAPEPYNLERPVSDLGAKSVTEIDGSGTGFTAGLQFRATDTVTLGLCYRSSVKLDLNGDMTLTPAVSPGSNITTEIELPPSVAVGIDYLVNAQLALEVDAIWMGWSSFDRIVIETNDPDLNYASDKYKDNVHFRLSLEYSADEIAVFRTGYFYIPSPVPEEYLGPIVPNAPQEGITLGIGKSHEQFTIDAVYMHSFKRERWSDYSKILSDGRYEYKADGFAISLSYRIN